MTTQDDLNFIASEIDEIPKNIKLCQEIVNALIETNQSCINDSVLISLLDPTDYERARKQIIRKCRSIDLALFHVRKSIISPEAIRAAAYLIEILNICTSCLDINRANIWNNKKFSCQMQEKYGKPSENEFRFELDQIGRIIEKL